MNSTSSSPIFYQFVDNFGTHEFFYVSVHKISFSTIDANKN